MTTIDDSLNAQRRWRSLQPGSPAPVLQVFADYSPESWWYTRYLPSDFEAGDNIQTVYISRHGFPTQINVAMISTNPSFVLFHRRTVTSSVYEQSVGSYPNVRPLFVVPDPEEISRNPTLPMPEYARMVQDSRDGKCTLVVESKESVAKLAKFGVPEVLYLPPLIKLPIRFRAETKLSSERKRVLIRSESYPVNDLIGLLLKVKERFSDCSLHLSLGDGFDSTQTNYREGIITLASILFPDAEVWPNYPRTRFLRRVSRDVDVVVTPTPGSTFSVESRLLEVPTYAKQGSELVELSRDSLEDVTELRKRFWRNLYVK